MRAQNKLGLLLACVTSQLAMAVGPSGPTQPGAPADCIMWYSAKEGDTASGIATTHNIPLATFMDANTQLSGDPLALWEGYNYCVPQGSRTASLASPDPRWLMDTSEEIADPLSQPPTDDSSEAAGSRETASTAEESSSAEAKGSTSDESVATSKDPSTMAKSTKSSQSSEESEPNTDSQSNKGSQSTEPSQSGTSSQPPTGSQQSTGSQAMQSSQSSRSSQSNTASEESDTSSESQSLDKSTTQTTMTTISIPPPSATTTMVIPAPITDKSRTESADKSEIKSDTEIETHGGDRKDTGGLAESFGAARRDLKGTETMEPRNLVAEKAEPPVTMTIRKDIILEKSTTYTSSLETPVTVTYRGLSSFVLNPYI